MSGYEKHIHMTNENMTYGIIGTTVDIKITNSFDMFKWIQYVVSFDIKFEKWNGQLPEPLLDIC